ncbi:MaoC family dehydratase [Streptomyces ipomoeae]|uniref:MaoC family dehydratase n=1 Tax=Streptomyces ipomoeae TaxID=103232 RepID=UPI001147692C|nr:MaoC family dehydratase [Streptomyces ipomoeae]MDX2937934.1 MaoC family dehydratase [Streptomyces ipomoeae]TQE18309.1 MaoC family dehydratase [Streptomyces ipomoeae]
MRTFQNIEELGRAVGTHLGHSPWHTVTQQQIDAFAEATGDRRCGYLTVSLLPLLEGEIYRVNGLTMGVNYGANKVRFPSPVPVGSRVRAGVELVSLVPGATGHLLTTRVTIEREDADKPSCVAEALSLLVP